MKKNGFIQIIVATAFGKTLHFLHCTEIWLQRYEFFFENP